MAGTWAASFVDRLRLLVSLTGGCGVDASPDKVIVEFSAAVAAAGVPAAFPTEYIDSRSCQSVFAKSSCTSYGCVGYGRISRIGSRFGITHEATSAGTSQLNVVGSWNVSPCMFKTDSVPSPISEADPVEEAGSAAEEASAPIPGVAFSIIAPVVIAESFFPIASGLGSDTMSDPCFEAEVCVDLDESERSRDASSGLVSRSLMPSDGCCCGSGCDWVSEGRASVLG